MRGSPVRGNAFKLLKRSIPAHAGEPSASHRWPQAVGVYPRACGGAAGQPGGDRRGTGLSPRMRGSLRRGFFRTDCPGSIPAHAGEPAAVANRYRPGRVYPRACGGAFFSRLNLFSVLGLSPRMRGSPGERSQTRDIDGSIPAHAGEPTRRATPGSVWGVYPRACGGASAAVTATGPLTGLSPRMRGSRATLTRAST